jgi:hypothetical protein
MKTLGKKLYIAFLWVFVLMPVRITAQTSSTPIIGYDKLVWGSTIQEFTRAYPTAREISSDNSSVGVREFEQKDVGNGIVERIFYFYNNRLYRVWVYYGEQDSSSFEALLRKVVSIYGKFDDQDESSNSDRNGSIKMIDFVRYYNNNLTVVVRGADIFNQYNYLVGSMLSCDYSNPITENEIRRALSKSKEEQFGL